MTELPSVGFFDRFASKAARSVSRAPFFAMCVAMVLIWAPSILVIRDIDTWQLIINTATTIVTFLLVALLQNSEARSEAALQHKLDVIAEGLRDLMKHTAVAAHSAEDSDFAQSIEKLERAVGIEESVGTVKN